MLLDHTSKGLHDKYGAHLLETSHFFLSTPLDEGSTSSTPVKKFTAFVSHAWSTNARQVVTALLVHVWLASGRLAFLVLGICITLIAMFYVYPPFTIVVLPFLAYALIFFLTLTHKSPRMLRVMGYGQPDLWFDKAMVHHSRRNRRSRRSVSRSSATSWIALTSSWCSSSQPIPYSRLDDVRVGLLAEEAR